MSLLELSKVTLFFFFKSNFVFSVVFHVCLNLAVTVRGKQYYTYTHTYNLFLQHFNSKPGFWFYSSLN
jgi:hypothetical protein